ncbi:MAG: hypothetical protein MUC90_02315 [Thermoplasmata archaeon]|jgi:hypothetical protein|nr:hypothetical protein [Thermoplasmata archaeon]
MKEHTLLRIIWVLQLSMVVLALVLIINDKFTWVPATVVSFLITLLPSMLKHSLRVVLPVWLVLWIVIALFLHSTGGAFGFYDDIPFWDHITHAVSASLIAALGFVVVLTIDDFFESIYLPRPFVVFFVLMFGMAIGVFWEVMEFAQDRLTGTMLQYNLDDTMWDLFFDGTASLVVAVFSYSYLRNKSPEDFISEMGLTHAKERVNRRLKSQ